MTDKTGGAVAVSSQLREDLTALLERLRAAQEFDYETLYFVLVTLMESLLEMETARLAPFQPADALLHARDAQ